MKRCQNSSHVAGLSAALLDLSLQPTNSLEDRHGLFSRERLLANRFSPRQSKLEIFERRLQLTPNNIVE